MFSVFSVELGSEVGPLQGLAFQVFDAGLSHSSSFKTVRCRSFSIRKCPTWVFL